MLRPSAQIADIEKLCLNDHRHSPGKHLAGIRFQLNSPGRSIDRRSDELDAMTLARGNQSGHLVRRRDVLRRLAPYQSRACEASICTKPVDLISEWDDVAIRGALSVELTVATRQIPRLLKRLRASE